MTSLYHYRRFIWQRAVAEVRHRYAGTSFGVVWNVLHPLAVIAIYSAVFSQLMPARIPGVNNQFAHVLYLCSGILPWLAFSECVTRGASAFLDNAMYLKKLPMPEQVFVASTAASATLGLAISFSLLLAVALALGLRPNQYWLLLPIPLVLLQVLGFALGLLLGTLNVFFRDIGQFLVVSLQLVFWTVPVVYMTDQVPVPGWVFRWHPLYPPLNAIHDLFLFSRLPDKATCIGLVAWPAIFLSMGWLAFSRLRGEIRDLL
ncbi:MAG TPA: ABC transporter permease [Tepidisphaeraceae bacterium]|jgi:ABC-type polysaccharide/polyol phosphate export permease|nr:ABC transporter permease [Tepidisphaeraceae bacterium]